MVNLSIKNKMLKKYECDKRINTNVNGDGLVYTTAFSTFGETST